MMSKAKKTCVLLLSVIMILSLVVPVSASEPPKGSNVNVLSQERAELIEQTLERSTALKTKKSMLQAQKEAAMSRISAFDPALIDKEKTQLEIDKEISVINREMLRIDNEVADIQEELLSLGAERPSKEFLIELLGDSLPQAQALTSSYHPSDLIDTFSGMYDVWGYPVTYAGREQYHLIFEYDGNDPYLSKNSTKVVYDEFNSGSTMATHWTNEVLKIYADKLIGTSLGVLDILPWELLFASKPSNTISSTGDATVATLSQVTVVKFVFVYDTANEDWFFALSTNRLNYGYTISAHIIRNSVVYADSESVDNQNVYGDYNSASSYANTAFNNYNPANRCITKLRLRSTSLGNDQISINIHSPSNVSFML